MSQSIRVLPSGWANAQITDFAIMSSGGTPSRKQPSYYDGNIPWAKIGDLDDGLVRETEETVSDEGLKKSSAKLMPENTLLLAMYGASIGKLGITKIPLSTNQAIACIRPNDEISVEYLFHFFKLSRRDLIKLGQGGAQPNISQTILKRVLIPIAPVAEQERIVDKIDELFSSIEAGERAIEQARAGVSRYRKAILKAAVTGELTADWRDENPTKESAKDLLARILTARYEAWEKSELAKLDAKGKPRPDTEKQWEKFRARYKPPVEPDLEKLPQLPDSWVWVLSDAVTQVTKLAGFEFTDFVNYVEDGDLPVVKAGNVAQNDYNSSEMAKVKSDEVSHLKRSELFGGEILMAFVGANLGKVSILPSTEKFFLGPNVAVIRPQAEFLSSQFGATFYQSDFGFTRLRNSSVGAAQGSISMGRIRNAAIPIMGQEEQAEIVDRVEQAFSKADAVEATLDAQSRAAKALKQAVLKTAFEGKLVPQNPKDEPASELLKRIKEET